MKRIKNIIIPVACFLTLQGQVEAAAQTKEITSMKEIYLAGGCFWGTEHFLKQISGVKATEVGYANGKTTNPDYKAVCTGRTGFAETVKVEYDPEAIGLNDLLDLFYKTIDPTSVNRQGNDRGSQYRTGIYFSDPADEPVIHRSLERLSWRHTAPTPWSAGLWRTFTEQRSTIRTTSTEIPEVTATSPRSCSPWPWRPTERERNSPAQNELRAIHYK